MARVPISKHLRETVQANIRSMRSMEYHSIKSPPEIAASVPAVMWEQTAWGEHYHLKAVIPPHWCQTIDTMYVEGHDTEGKAAVREYVHVAVKGPPRGAISTVILNAADYPQVAEWVEYKAQRKMIADRWLKLENEVMGFLDSCKSLNEAVKLLPDLKYYLSQHYKDRLEQVVEYSKPVRSGAHEAIKALDADALVAGVVAARMAEANNG